MRRKAHITGVMALVTLLCAAPLRAQEEGMARVRQAFSGTVVERIQDALDRAAGEELPTEPLISKALEGVAKGVPGQAVAEAVSGYADALRQGRQAVGADAAPGAQVAAADALRGGLDPEDVRRMAERAGSETPSALVVLTDLSKMDVPVDRAIQAVTDALERGQRGPELLALAQRARVRIRGGQPPGRALGRAAGRGGLPGQVPGFVVPGPGMGIPSGPPVPPGSGPPGSVPGGVPGAGGS